MNVKVSQIEYWIELADYDLKTAHSLLKTQRYLYVGFLCHLSSEKILKALYVKIKNQIPPKTHNLRFLLKDIDYLKSLPDNLRNFIYEIEPLNIETRYPTEKSKLFNYLTKDKCKFLIEMSEELNKWIKIKLSE